MRTHLLTADLEIHREILLELQSEYLCWVFEQMRATFGPAIDASLATVASYAEQSLAQVCAQVPPQGVFYLLLEQQTVIGMGGLRRIRPGVAEIKRVYIRPAYRGKQLGGFVVRCLQADARRFGYRSVYLDSAPFMTSAHRLYESLGFTDCAAYPETEVAAELRACWRFMRCDV